MSHTDDCTLDHRPATLLGFATLARRIVARVAGWRRERETRAVLDELGAEQLRDIGLERTEIGYVAVAPWACRR